MRNFDGYKIETDDAEEDLKDDDDAEDIIVIDKETHKNASE